MTAMFASLNGFRVVRATLRVPGRGVWVADVSLDAVPPVPFPALPFTALLVIGDLTLVGTVAAPASGVFAQQQHYRVIGGGGGWSKALVARGYHNDVGILASLVLGDAALEAGELATVLDVDHALEGVDFAREAGPASRLFGQLFDPTVAWWVDYDGTTKVASARPAPVVDPSLQLELLDYYPSKRIAVFATETPSAIQIGQTITDARLTTPLVVRELELELGGGPLRVKAWVDEDAGTGGQDNRVLRAFDALVRRALPKQRYIGFFRYRVIAMSSGRADLQVVDPSIGLPDLTLVRLAPGMAGMTAELTLGAVVIVAFIEGDPSMPFIAHYSTTDDAAYAPESITITSNAISLGDDGGTAVALAPPLVTWTAAVRAALASASPPITVPGLDAGVAATKVKAS